MSTRTWSVPEAGARGVPVVVALGGTRCLVVGGGPVAARRARVLVASGARVTVVAPRVDAALRGQAAAGDLQVEARAYRPGEATAYRFVVTATGVPETDRAVVADALAAGVLVASADGASPGNVTLPAVHRDGPVTIAVSTDGASPAFAAWLRTRLASALGPGTAALAAIADDARRSLRRTGVPGGSVDWSALLDEAAPLADAGRVDEARAVLFARCGLDAGGAAGRREDGGRPAR